MSSTDWYARKLRGAPPASTGALPATPIRRPQPAAQEYEQPQEQPAHPPQSLSEALARGVTNKPDPSTRKGFCPECGSGNYTGPPGGMPRCFDCGYVPGRDFRNSTQGIIGDGPATPARQVPSPGYQPGTIIGKVT